jgi:hypothetical protein
MNRDASDLPVKVQREQLRAMPMQVTESSSPVSCDHLDGEPNVSSEACVSVLSRSAFIRL